MCKANQRIAVILAGLFMSEAAVTNQYTGYLTVNDEDYGYWEGQPMVVVAGERKPLEELVGLSAEPLVFELAHDLVQGLVRQFVTRPTDPAAEMSMAVSETADAAGVAAAPQNSVGENSWVRIGNFQTLGVGQYEGSDPTYGIYCDRNPSVWVWLAGDRIEELSPEDAANRVLKDDNGMARLKLACEGGMELSR